MPTTIAMFPGSGIARLWALTQTDLLEFTAKNGDPLCLFSHKVVEGRRQFPKSPIGLFKMPDPIHLDVSFVE